MSGIDRPQFERQRHWSGQTLRSRDFNDQLAVESEYRWWHNRALHAAYGVAQGLAVIVQNDGHWRVRPGLAYDCFGRELVLTRTKQVKVPAALGKPYTLLIRLPMQPETSSEAELVWTPTRGVALRDGVPLHEIDADGNVLGVDVFRPPISRPLARPLIGNGATVAGNTDWRYWGYPDVDFDGDGSSDPIVDGVEVTVDTLASGFTDIPCYFAWLQGGPLSRPTFVPQPMEFGRVVELALTGRREGPRLMFERIIETKPDHFVFSLTNFSRNELLAFARSNLYVCWIGIQPAVEEVNRDKIL